MKPGSNTEDVIKKVAENIDNMLSDSPAGAADNDPASDEKVREPLSEKKLWWAKNIKYFVYIAEALIFVGIIVFLIYYFTK